MSDQRKDLSTSALAKKLGKTSKQMFAELEALGWIRRIEERWELTAKGEFEQGRYRSSEKYGTYIIWPESVMKHRSLLNADDRFTSAKGLALKTQLTAMKINRLLADLGWIRRHMKGWQVTSAGSEVDGRQREDERTGIPYVIWPKELVEQRVFKRALRQLTSRIGAVETQVGCVAIDGHLLRSEAEVMIDNWLYLADINHACRKQLPVDEDLQADFFIPQGNLYIEFWGTDSAPGYLADKLRKKELFQQYNLNVLELQEEDLKQLDQLLPKQLLRYGIEG
ncbi:hypothetical protein [Amphritea sp. HPY]|uniref:hypothetical protein n=1 Tax=Amphritea sp. HPY TaxID=3421652 RepID=UPI003D7D36B0